MSYRNPQLNVRSDAALYTNFFKNISSSFSKIADAYSKQQVDAAALAKENKELNEEIDKETADYKAKINASVIKADSSVQVDLVESYKPILKKLGELRKASEKTGATSEQKDEFRAYEIKVSQSIGVAKNGLIGMAEKGQALVDAKENNNFDNTLNSSKDVLAFESINKGGVNKVVIDLDDPTSMSWAVSTPEDGETKGELISSFDFNNIITAKQSDDTDYWTTIPGLEYPGLKEVITDEKDNFLEGVPVKEVRTLTKSTDKKNVYQISQVIDFEKATQPGSSIMLQLDAAAESYLAIPQEAASLWNNKLLPLDKTKKQWLGPLNGDVITNEQKADFKKMYVKSFFEGQAKAYVNKTKTIEANKEQGDSDPKPGAKARALIANLNSLNEGQVGSTFDFEGKTVTQTGEKEWTLTQEVVDRDGNASTKEIAKVDDPKKLKNKFGIIDAALVPTEAEVNIDMAVNNALDPQ